MSNLNNANLQDTMIDHSCRMIPDKSLPVTSHD